MKKLSLHLIIILLIAAFAAADYFVNVHSNSASSDSPSNVQLTEKDPHLVEEWVLKDSQFADFRLARRHRSTQLFERFDLSAQGNMRIYVNVLESESKSPITIYEIQGPKDRGGLTYLAVKLALIEQMDATGNINEVGSYGYNSFFYNDVNRKDTGFLLAQVRDNCFGFQYNKNDEESFETVKSMINVISAQSVK